MDDDIYLAERARDGETAAFELLYRRHVARIHALCTRLAGDRSTGEDLVQESFVQAWRKIAQFRGDSSFGTWLYRIATNTALAHLRSRPDWRLHEELDEAGGHLPVQAGPATVALDLERAIATLPPRARGVLVLHDIGGYSHMEIAAMMDMAEGSSKAQLHRARQALVRILS